MKKIYIEPRMKVAGMLPEDHILGHSLDWADAKRKKDWDDEDWEKEEEDTTSAQIKLWDNIWGEED